MLFVKQAPERAGTWSAYVTFLPKYFALYLFFARRLFFSSGFWLLFFPEIKQPLIITGYRYGYLWPGVFFFFNEQKTRERGARGRLDF